MLDDRLAAYHFGEDHPFGPDRYWAFKREFEHRGFSDDVRVANGRIASEQELLLFHTPSCIERVRTASAQGNGYLDQGDTPARKGIFEAALQVVGTTLQAVDLTLSNPGAKVVSPIAGLHHATRTSSAGFCVFNDCGVAIEYLRQHHGIQRVAYVDIDAHHGDGVFYSFEDDPELIFVDMHQDGRTLYPGTGMVEETGTGAARGTKMNIPLPPGARDRMAMPLWNTAEQFIRDQKPEFIILQCGADSVKGDPITSLELSAGFHGHVASRLRQVADELCGGRMIALGGGGYNLENLASAWNNVVAAMVGEQS
ncbi:MAG: acetoin utilization protein AcuC [bacterium]